MEFLFLQMQYSLVIYPNLLTGFVFEMNVLYLIIHPILWLLKSLKLFLAVCIV